MFVGNNNAVPRSAPHPLWARFSLAPLATKGTLALLDQAVVSGANFLATVIIGRACGKEELGVYALAFSIVVLVICAQESLVSTPYAVYCHRQRGASQAEYAGSVLVHHGLIALLAMICFAGCGVALLIGSNLHLWGWLSAVLAGVVPFALARDFARRMRFAQLKMASALILDSAVAVLQIGGLLMLAAAGRLSALSAFAPTGVSCGVVVLWWFTTSKGQFVLRRSRVFQDLRHNWAQGRWVFAAMMALMLQLSAIPWLIAFMLGAGAAGAFAACMSIVMLGNPIIHGVSNLLVPKAALAFAENGAVEVRRVVINTTRLLGTSMAVFYGMIVLFAEQILSLLYGAEFIEYRTAVTILALSLLVRAVGTSAYNGLKAIERANVNFKINVVALVATLALCPPLMLSFQVAGAAFSLLVGDATATVLRWVALMRMASVPAEEEALPEAQTAQLEVIANE